MEGPINQTPSRMIYENHLPGLSSERIQVDQEKMIRWIKGDFIEGQLFIGLRKNERGSGKVRKRTGAQATRPGTFSSVKTDL